MLFLGLCELSFINGRYASICFSFVNQLSFLTVIKYFCRYVFFAGEDAGKWKHSVSHFVHNEEFFLTVLSKCTLMYEQERKYLMQYAFLAG